MLFVVDMSGSQYFGTGERLKSEVAAEITALLAFSAVKNHDKTGLLIVTDEVEKYVPVQKGRMHVLRVVREILFYKPRGTRTSLRSAFEYLHKILTRTAVIFVISDFLDENFEKSLKILARRNDVIALHLRDRRETQLPAAGLMELLDRETGERLILDSSDSKLRKRFEAAAAEREARLDKLFKSLRIDRVAINVEGSYIEPLMKFFKIREKRM